MNNTIRTTSGKCINVSGIKVGDKVKVVDRDKISLGYIFLENNQTCKVRNVENNKVWITDVNYDGTDGYGKTFVLVDDELQGIELVDDEPIAETNGDFTEKQILAYASTFEAGDAIWCDGKWWEVEGGKRGSALLTNAPNQYLLKSYNRITLTSGFYEDDELKSPYRVTTLRDYELQGGEKLVWLGDRGVMIGEVFKTFVDIHGNVVYENEFKRVVKPTHQEWGIIPLYKQVAQSKERKFNKGDKVLTLSGSTGVVKGYSDDGNCLVSITNREGENDVYSFLEEDLTVYLEEPKARRVESTEVNRPAASHYHDNNNGNDVWQFVDDNLSSERVKGFHQTNAIKYVARYHKKHDTTEKRIEDLEKAKVSIDKLIELERKG